MGRVSRAAKWSKPCSELNRRMRTVASLSSGEKEVGNSRKRSVFGLLQFKALVDGEGIGTGSEAGREMMFRKLLLLISLVIAILAASTRWSVLPLAPATFTFVFVSAVLAIPWTVPLVISVLRYGKRGLWVLVGLPLVLLWPALLGLLWVSCHWGAECI